MGVRLHALSGNYYLDYRAKGRRIREVIGSNKKLADQVWAKRQTELAENKFLDKRKEEKIKFGELADLYLENHAKVNKKSWASTDVHYIKKLKEHFGNWLITDISSIDIEKFKAQRQQDGVSKAYVNRELTCLKCIFNRAIDWGKFFRLNPVKKVKLYKENNKRVRYLVKDEMTRLLDECKGELRAMVMVAINTGLRRGEILDLKWTDVDLHSDNIFIRKSKSGDSRIIPMNRSVKEVLYSMSLKKEKKDDVVFVQRHREAFENAVIRAKITNFKFHDLRHHFASYAAMAGMDINTLREIMGHKSLTMTLRYSHLSPSHKSQAVKLLDNFWMNDEAVGKIKKEKASTVH